MTDIDDCAAPVPRDSGLGVIDTLRGNGSIQSSVASASGGGSAATLRTMRTLHPAFRVTDLEGSLEFYRALGYREVGRVEFGGTDGTLVMLGFPGEELVTLELAYRPNDGPVEQGSGFDHLGIQVDDLAVTVAALGRAGLRPGPIERPGGPNGPRTAWLTDPDGYRLELVQWPLGHPVGLTAADFCEAYDPGVRPEGK